MQPYGMKKRGSSKLHPHNKCDTCSENNFNKKTARQDSKKIIRFEFETKEQREKKKIVDEIIEKSKFLDW